MYCMSTSYEHLHAKTRVPIEMLLETIEGDQLHRHKQLEILFVLEGTINLRIEENSYRLEENDLVIINRYELHGLFATTEKNAVLKFQIDTDYYNYYFPNYSTKQFDCNTISTDQRSIMSKDSPFEKIRQQLATLANQWHEKESGYQLAMGTTLLVLGNILMLHFESKEVTKNKSSRDVQRLNRILDYIDLNFEKGVNLQEIAEIEQLNPYYLSTFIKQNLGMNFQEYVNMKRLEKVMDQLITTDKKITDIAFESGFSTTKSMNQLFKRILEITPSKFRERYIGNQEEASQLDPFGLRKQKSYKRPENYHELIIKLYSHL